MRYRSARLLGAALALLAVPPPATGSGSGAALTRALPLTLAALTWPAQARRSTKKKAAPPPPPKGPQSASANALLKQGKDAQRQGDGARAMGHFDQAAQAAESDGDKGTAARAHGAAGRLLLSVNQGEQAVERLGMAVAMDPSYSAGHLNLAHAHLTNGDHRRGLRVVLRFLDTAPTNADAHRIHGHLLAATGDSAAAEKAWRTALRHKPGDSESAQALALSLFGATTASAEAAAATRVAAGLLYDATLAALEKSGHDLDALFGGGGNGALSRATLEQLEATWNPALPLRRSYRRMFALSCVAARRVANWADAEGQTRRLQALLQEERDDSGAAASGPPSLDPAFALVVPLSGAETVALSRDAVTFFHKDAIAAPATRRQPPERRPLRICYIGSEFGDKPVGHLLVALVSATNAALSEEKDGTGLISFVYQLAAEPALPTLQALYGGVTPGGVRHTPLSAKMAIEPGGATGVEWAMAADECDVVVDMLGWSMELQATIARHASGATKTISMLAYPATRAAPYIDALIGDPLVAPPELRPTAYGEPVIDMPYSYHVTDQAAAFPNLVLDDSFARSQRDFGWLPRPPRAGSLRRQGPLVLCNFNSEWRVTPPAWAVWTNLLRRLGGAGSNEWAGGATLWQVGTVDAALANLKLEMGAAGMDQAKHLAVTAKRSRSDHLKVAPACDFHLDSPDHNAHSTGLDGLWAGVPLLTVPGERFAARVGASIVGAMGLSWRHNPTVFSFKEYEDYGALLGRNATHLAGLRKDVRRARTESPLFDTKGWARSYERMLEETITSS